MMMKKKMFLGIVAFLFIAATAINVNLAQQSRTNNALLANIAVMAQAQTELPGVDIICGQSGGRCWAFEGAWDGEHYIPCYFTGDQSHFCV